MSSKSFNLDIDFAKAGLEILEIQRREKLKVLEGDPMKDLEYVQIRLSQEVYENMLLRAEGKKLAYRIRDRSHKDLGKQYGIASREIARLKGELALQREKYNAMLMKRGQWFD